MKKQILIFIIGMFFINLVYAQDINISGTNYHISNYSSIDGIEYCLTLQGYENTKPCSNYITEFKGQLIFNSTAMIDLNYTLYCWSHDCTPEMSPFYEENNIIDYDGNIVLADDFIVNSRIYTGDTIKEINNITTIPTTNSKYEEIDHKDGVQYGFSWLLKAIKDIVNRLTGAEQEINYLKQENARVKECISKSKDFNSLKICMS